MWGEGCGQQIKFRGGLFIVIFSKFYFICMTILAIHPLNRSIKDTWKGVF